MDVSAVTHLLAKDLLCGASEPALYTAIREAREWHWGAASDALKRAYNKYGVEGPEVSVQSWHCGDHPIQREARRIRAARLTAESAQRQELYRLRALEHARKSVANQRHR